MEDNSLLTALISKATGSAFLSDIGGRLALDFAESDWPLPYTLISIVTSSPDRTFTESYWDSIVQFSTYSALSAGSVEMTTIQKDLLSLYDECSLTITGFKLVWMRHSNLVTFKDDVMVGDASVGVRFWANDFEIKVSKN